jgi:hypothetical protein
MENLAAYKSRFSAMIESLKRYAEVSGAVCLDGARNFVAQGETHTFNITNYDRFSTYAVTTNQGSVTLIKDTITITTSATLTPVNPFVLTVRKNGITRVINMKIVSIGVSPIEFIAPTPFQFIDGNSTLLSVKPFDVYPAGSQTHVSTDWQVSADPNFISVAFQSMGDAVNKLSINALGLPYGTRLYARARHNGSSTNAAINQGPWVNVEFRTGQTRLTNFDTSWVTSWEEGILRQTSRNTAWDTQAERFNQDTQQYETYTRQTSRTTLFDTVESYQRQTNHYTDNFTEWDTTKQVYTSYQTSQVTGYWQAGGPRYSSYVSAVARYQYGPQGVFDANGNPTGEVIMVNQFMGYDYVPVNVYVGQNPDYYVSYNTAYQAGRWTDYITHKTSGYKGQTYYLTAIDPRQTSRVTHATTERSTRVDP